MEEQKNTMKLVIITLIIAIIAGITSIGAPLINKNMVSVTPKSVKLKTFADSVSYAIGHIYGMDLADVPYKFNYRLLVKGVVNARDRYISVMSEGQIIEILNRFQEEMSDALLLEQEVTRTVNKEEGQAYMIQNALDPDVKTTASGIQYKIITNGAGKRVGYNSNITAHYTAKFISGESFLSTHSKGEPMTFNVNEVITGWSEGLKLMREGDIFEFVIPDSLAYGDEGYEIIEPGAYLIFEVEMIKVE